MLGISRWTGAGGSYPSMLRFFHTVIPWATLFWLFFRKHLFRANEVYFRVLATFGDDERLRALRQKAEGRRQKKERKEEVVNLSFKFV